MTEDSTKYFFELTPDRILDAVESIGVRCTGRALALNSMENRVYEVEIEVADPSSISSRHESFRVAKFYRPGRWTTEQIQEEHEFLGELLANDIPVVAPIAFPDGSTVQQLKESEIWYSVFPKFGGRIKDELSDEELTRIGRLIARVHLVGGMHPSNARVHLTPKTYGRDNLAYLLERSLVVPTIRDYYSRVVNDICSVAENWLSGVQYQRLHGDTHLGNILWTESGCHILDFDDMVMGPPIQDLWLIAAGRDEESMYRREILLAGYEQLKALDRSTLRLIEPLRALRIIHFSAWIGRRWDDPSFKRVFPDYGSEEYWRDQLATLSEIRDLLFAS